MTKKKKDDAPSGDSRIEEDTVHRLVESMDGFSGQNALLRQQVGQLYEVVKNLWDAVQAQLIQARDSDQALRSDVRQELGKYQLDGPQRAMTSVFAKLFRDLVGFIGEVEGLANLARAHREQLGDEWVSSVEVTRDGFEAILKDWGCNEIPVRVGEVFDPARHEAVEAELGEVDESEEEHRVVALRRRGWTLHGIVVQIPQIVVS